MFTRLFPRLFLLSIFSCLCLNTQVSFAQEAFTVVPGQDKTFSEFNYHDAGVYDNTGCRMDDAYRRAESSGNQGSVSIELPPPDTFLAYFASGMADIGLNLTWDLQGQSIGEVMDMPVKITYLFNYRLSAEASVDGASIGGDVLIMTRQYGPWDQCAQLDGSGSDEQSVSKVYEGKVGDFFRPGSDQPDRLWVRLDGGLNTGRIGVFHVDNQITLASIKIEFGTIKKLSVVDAACDKGEYKPDESGTITCRVIDQTGAAVPDASVSARINASTQVVFLAADGTGGYSGSFIAPHQPAEMYRVDITADKAGCDSGFGVTIFNVVQPTADLKPQTPQEKKDKVGEPVDVASGEMDTQAADFMIPAPGLPLEFTRSFHSYDDYAGQLGFGWRANFDIGLQEDAQGAVTEIDSDAVQTIYTPQGNGTYIASAGKYSQLVKHPDGTYALTRKGGTVLDFDSAGRLLKITDRNLNFLEIVRNAGGAVMALRDCRNRSIEFTLDGQNRIVAAKDPLNRQYAYVYDAAGDLVSVTNPTGNISYYQYDSSHHITAIIDRNGHQVSFAYDTQGRCVFSSPENNINRVQLTYADHATTVTDSLGRATTYEFNDRGLTTRIIDPSGNTRVKVWDDQMNCLSLTDTRGHTTSFTYDTRGNLLSSTDALGNTSAFTYVGIFDLPASSTDPLGNQTRYEYDSNGDMVRLIDALANTQVFTYAADGRVLTAVDAKGNVTSFAYDAYGNLIATTDALGNLTTLTYDLAGRKLSLTDAKGNITSFEYDALDDLTAVTRADNTRIIYTYDPEKNLLSSTDPLGNVRRTVYDTAYRVVEQIDPLNQSIKFTYDTESNKLTMTDLDNGITAYQYDSLDRLVRETSPTGKIKTFAYDSEGNQISSTDQNNQTITYAYDQLNRLTGSTGPTGETITYTYDANSNRLSMTGKEGVTTYVYDQLNRLVSTADFRSQTIAYAYDANGNRISMTDPDNVATAYVYDALNRLTQISDPRSGLSTYTYDANSNVSTLSLANSAASAYTYDALNRLLTLTNSSSGVSDSKAYTYDLAGRLTSILEAGGTHTDYAYDGLSRLVSEKILQPQLPGANGKPRADKVLFQRAYAYDPAGNRTSMTAGQTTFDYTYDPDNQLLSMQKTVIQNKLPLITQQDAYTYDNNGNRLTKTVTGASITAPQVSQYSYDYLNQLTQVINPKGQSVNYDYDSAGRRISRTLGAASLIYRYDGATVLADLNKKGKVIRRYTRNPLSNGGINGLLAIETRIPVVKSVTPPAATDTPEDTPPDVEEPADIDPLSLGDFYYYQYDHLGSVTGLSDAAGLLTTQYSYTASGLTRTSSGLNQGSLYKYSSKAYDGAAGLYYYGARYYDPQVGRWLTQDPLGMVDGPNKYLYVSNNPVNYVDPWGLAEVIFGLPYNGNLANPGLPSLPLGAFEQSQSEMGKTQSGKINKSKAEPEKLKGGKQEKRDRNWGYPFGKFRGFWQWFHKEKQKQHLSDISSKEEADTYYRDYLSGGF